MASPTRGVSTRSMRLKVLYTFDTESKNNCVARWPHALDIQTAFVDDLTQIGVVGLITCIQALASSSPELFSQDATDYTVYAYDYSEEGTPMSGQGLLSIVFDSDSPHSITESSSKVVTGRVTKNVLGLFAGNGQETLEVKLRLLPVAKQGLQHSIHSQSPVQSFSAINDQSYDADEWRNTQPMNNRSSFRQQSVSVGSPLDTTGLENMQRMLHEGDTSGELSANRPADSLRGSSNSRPASRSGTPTLAPAPSVPSRQLSSQASRPPSRASVRGGVQPASYKRRESFNSGYYSDDENQVEEGPQRKRVKVTQIRAPSRSDLNIERQPESLRMVASTASSVRVHRPAAVNPAVSHLQGGGGNLAEEPMRPPTPIPGAKKPVIRRLQTEPSTLRRGSQQDIPSDMTISGQGTTDIINISATSPAYTRVPSIPSTPANIPSSPPVRADYGSMPSSPALPLPGPDTHDSGFMSGFDPLTREEGAFLFNDYLQTEGHDVFQSQMGDEESTNIGMFDHFTPAMEQGNEIPEEVLPVTLPPHPPPPPPPAPPAPPQKPVDQSGSSNRPPSRAHSSRPAVRSGMSSPKLAPAPYPRARQMKEEMSAQSNLPLVAASDAAGRQFHRANSWAGQMSDMPTSEAPTSEIGKAKLASKKKVGREQTKARLENALAQNEMPPYCDNCGTIETPAWRRVFAKTLPGNLWDSVELWPEIPGAFVWKQMAEQEEDGSIKTFRAYKLSKSPDDKGDEWVSVTLCNPCGLWFHKNKCLRPEEKWSKNPKDPKKKKRAYRPKSKRVAAKKGQDDDGKSDAPDPGSEGSSPADAATDQAEMDGEDESQKTISNVATSGPETELQGELGPGETTSGTNGPSPYPPPSPPPYSLPENLDPRLAQSSPIRNDGSPNDATEVGLTPKPLCRQLFSSPAKKTASLSQSSAKSNTVKPLGDVTNSCRRSPRLNKSLDVFKSRPRTPEPADKENRPPRTIQDDALDALFDGGENENLLPPTTPTPTRRSDRRLLSTPTRTPGGRALRTPGAHHSPTVKRGSQKSHPPKGNRIIISNENMSAMSPFTRMMQGALLEEASRGDGDSTEPRRPAYPPPEHPELMDFAHLPSLDGASPTPKKFTSHDGFDLSNAADLDEFFRDLPQTHSEPDGYYNFLDSDYLDPAMGGGEWAGMEEVNSAENLVTGQAVLGLRRSPRKNKAGLN